MAIAAKVNKMMRSETLTRDEPCAGNGHSEAFATRLLRSYRTLTGRDLLPAAATPAATAHTLYHARFVVLAHDAAADPTFVYANLAAQRLFEMPWRDIVGMPSRYSAEAVNRDERQRLLERVARDGYIDDYQGVRISSTGKRFAIRRATVWNISDDVGRIIGQAASFSEWKPIDAMPMLPNAS